MTFKSQVIHRFSGLQYPLICPSFYKLSAFYGCAWGKCRECYLRATYFRMSGGKVPQPTIYKSLTWERLKGGIIRFTKSPINPQLLNTGELADSLSFEDGGFFHNTFSELIVPFMEFRHKHKVLFLSKLTNVKQLLQQATYVKAYFHQKAVERTVLSWTLNMPEIAKLLREPPNVNQRINSARLCKSAGYEVRIRIDPIIPEFNYEPLVLSLLDKLTPSRITLGSLRINNPRLPGTDPEFWAKWIRKMVDLPGGKKRFPFEVDVQSFSRIMDMLKDYGYQGDISLCKEHVKVWEGVGLPWQNCNCNCLL